MPPRGTGRGFTLVELLIVIVIISVLAAMTLSVISMVKDRARDLATSARMENVLNGLTTYASTEGSTAVALQAAYGLGGVAAFAPVKVIRASLTAGCATPPGFRSWQLTGYGTPPGPPDNGQQWPAGNWWPPGWTDLDETNYAATPERVTLYRRLADEVVDVLPPTGAIWAKSDYSNPTLGGWPTQWPETDWDKASPGTVPPILRFPWGKAGLRIDGSLADPNQDNNSSPTTFTEMTRSGGQKTTATEPVRNAWVTTGTSATGLLWTWNSDNAAQTDSVTLATATRSDGTPVGYLGTATTNSNRAMPFDAGWMSPLRSLQLLQAAGVVRPGTDGENDYRNDRKLSQPWNNAWGFPLVVVYAMYQPERYVRSFDGYNRRDLLLKAAQKEYQYTRSLYFAVGAAGPTVPPSVARIWTQGDDPTQLRELWLHVRKTAGAVDWNEDSFSKPPWRGVRKQSLGGYKAFLSAPNEIK